MLSFRTLLLLSSSALAAAQYPGHGISKSTYSCNDPVAGWTWMYKYFPVDTPEDECDDNICKCDASGSVPTWYIQQGRVYTKMNSELGAPAGNGFGLHLVNVSKHLTTGGLSTAQVEAHFNDKVGEMKAFDSFMDFSVAFSTDDLQGYKDTFKADGVPTLAATWQSSDKTNYTSLFVQVPNSQLILELCSKASLTYSADEAKPVRLEQRVSSRALAHVQEARAGMRRSSKVGSILTPLAVGRAASKAAMAKLEDFYVGGMGTKMTLSSKGTGVTKKCFLWSGASVEVCYTERPENQTKGSWKVADFEDMLNTVHKTIIGGHPLCGIDKWEDNHYAIDSQSADTSKIVAYIEKEDPFYYCDSSGPDETSASLHYIFDPCGWGIQLDLGFSSQPSGCSSSSRRGLRGTFNPACTTAADYPDECPTSLLEPSAADIIFEGTSFTLPEAEVSLL